MRRVVVEQWIWMATEYKIGVVLCRQWGQCIECPSVWDYNYSGCCVMSHGIETAAAGLLVVT